jgi:hypothetical protein
MKKYFVSTAGLCLLFAGLCFSGLSTATAQEQSGSTGFHSVACVKVRRGKSADFKTLVDGTFLKYAQSRVDSGAISGWLVLRTVIPAGQDAACDYAFVTFYPGLPNAPMSDDEAATAFKKAGISGSLDEMRQQRDASGYLVSNGLERTAVQVGHAKKGDYIIVNIMNVPDTGAWIANEKKRWQPIFEDGVKDGSVDGWSVVEQFLPRGAKDLDTTYTVDIYPSWDAMFKFFGSGFSDRWKKVNPDVSIEQGMDQEHKVDTIDHTILYHVVASVQSSK